MYQALLYSFWKNLSGHFDHFACNHSYDYALITGVLPFTLRAHFTLVKSFLRFYRGILQTTATDGGSVDFAGASHRPDSLKFPKTLYSYEISGLKLVTTC